MKSEDPELKKTEQQYLERAEKALQEFKEIAKSDPKLVFGDPDAKPIYLEREPDKYFEFDAEMDDEDYAMALLENLQRKQFPLKDLGITSRVFNHWKQQGLVPGSEDGKWAYFDFIQYLWLQMVKDLRSFGLPLETIALVKDFLFNEQFLQQIELSREDKAKYRKELEKKVKRRITEQELADAISIFETGNTYLPYYFSMVVLNYFLNRSETNILVYADGTVRVLDGNATVVAPEVAPQPHLVLPLAKYFAAFLNDETKAEFLPSLPFISHQENQVLQALRDNNVKELTLKFIEDGKEKQLELITKKDGLVSPEHIGRFTDLLSSRNVVVTMKTRNDQKLYYTIEKRRKIRF